MWVSWGVVKGDDDVVVVYYNMIIRLVCKSDYDWHPSERSHL